LKDLFPADIFLSIRQMHILYITDIAQWYVTTNEKWVAIYVCISFAR